MNYSNQAKITRAWNDYIIPLGISYPETIPLWEAFKAGWEAAK